MSFEVVGAMDGGARLAAALQRAGQNMEIVGAIADVDPELAQAMAGKNFRKIDSNTDFGLVQNIGLPLANSVALGAVPTATAFTLTGSPVRAFKPTRLIIGSSLPAVEISGFSIAQMPQFLNTGSVPSEAFSALSIEDKWDFTMCPAQSPVVVSGTNRNAATNTIYAMLFGKSTQG